MVYGNYFVKWSDLVYVFSISKVYSVVKRFLKIQVRPVFSKIEWLTFDVGILTHNLSLIITYNTGGVVTLDPCGHLCSLDGVQVTVPTPLTQGKIYTLSIAQSHCDYYTLILSTPSSFACSQVGHITRAISVALYSKVLVMSVCFQKRPKCIRCLFCLNTPGTHKFWYIATYWTIIYRATEYSGWLRCMECAYFQYFITPVWVCERKRVVRLWFG